MTKANMRGNTAFGQVLEANVVLPFARCGYPKMSFPEWRSAGKNMAAPRALVGQVPYTNPLGGRGRSDWCLCVSEGEAFTVRIECKWQDVSGTTDEKLPYAALALIDCPEPNVILVCDGAHYGSPRGVAMKQYVADKIMRPAEQNGIKRMCRVMSVSELHSWIQKTYRKRA